MSRSDGPLGDEGTQERLQRQEDGLHGEALFDLETVLSTPAGRRLYFRIAYLLCGLEAPSYASSGQYMAFLEGRRSIAHILKQQARQSCPKLWKLMNDEREAAEDEFLRLRNEAITLTPKEDDL